MLFRTNCDFTDGSAEKQIQDTYEAVYMNVSEEKLSKLREEKGFERVGQYYIVGDIPSAEKYTAAFFT